MFDQTNLPAWREQPLGRRIFLRVSAATVASVSLVAAGCDTTIPQPIAVNPNLLALPAADSGLYYFAYLLALAQTTVLQKITAAFPTDFTTADRALFTALRDHEVIGRELLRYIIDPTLAVVLLPTDFVFSTTSFTLTTRAGALAAARQLADLRLAVYPSLLPLFSSAAAAGRNLMLKQLSVYARHAATLHELLMPGSFANADVVESTGLRAGQLRTKTPVEAAAALAPYFAPYVISIANLPVPA